MKRFLRRSTLIVVGLALLITIYVKTHPRVFNESFFCHAHCIRFVALQLTQHAATNDGRFPRHPNGYVDALLSMDDPFFQGITGPGYDWTILAEAKQQGRHVSEEECGRVYIQGLTRRNSRLAILFDKQPTPGGDHCHLFHRLFAPLGCEVAFVDGSIMFITESEWPAFAQEQIELLAREGIARAEAERLYSQVVK